MIKLLMEQGSPEWFAARLGNVGASNFHKIITSKGEPSKQAKEYLYQLAGEVVSGYPEETYQSIHMSNGLERESKAREYFEIVTGLEVEQVGICFTDDKKYHCSPDGLLNNSGIEIKCPMAKTHVSYLVSNKLPAAYLQQVQGSMLVTGYNNWYFMSYYEGLPPLILNIERDDTFCDKLKEQLEKFCYELAELVKKIRLL